MNELDSLIFWSSYWYWFVFGMLANLTIGVLIGRARGSARTGFWLAFLLGPIGWLITALFEPAKPKPAEISKELREALYQQRLAATDPVEQWEREQKRQARAQTGA